MQYHKRKNVENPWLGLTKEETEKKLAEAFEAGWKLTLDRWYEVAVSEGYEGSRAAYEKQLEFPFAPNGGPNPKYPKSWDGSRADRQAQAKLEAAGKINGKQLKL
jgi:hypothetical protein